MKRYFSILVVFLWASLLVAQTNQPVRLAIVPETPHASATADLLTAEISQNNQVHLLERTEIERVYREQGLSAANRDSLKLGQILGADGLLLLESAEETNQVVNAPVSMPKSHAIKARLIAVKPGIVLADETFLMLDKDLPEWGSSFAKYLNLFLPKLAVQGGDAIPISVVNLRSAISSTDASETEQQLKSLTIQRLSREPQMFVLERQRMQLLSEEKALQSDESAFWNGSYLLEGVVDKNGFSPDTITIDARLTPPKGGQPLLFQISGSRTNLAEVVNLLAVKVTELLKVNSASKGWNTADEAAQYFGEAQWALRWGVYPEAQSAVESAWALGKKDLTSAVLRNKAYLQALSAAVGTWQTGESSASPGFDADGKPVGPAPTDADVDQIIQEIMAVHKFFKITKITSGPYVRTVYYAFREKAPANETIDQAIHVLELYDQFSRTSPDGEPKILWRGKGWSDWHDSEWYKMGIDDLVVASEVLQWFDLAPDLQAPVADKLAELRARARSVASMISSAPSVHDSYFVGDRLATYDELDSTLVENPSIFRCEVSWGSYWQEKPEDTIVLYRELIESPTFCYIHSDFWLRELQTPRLVAWNKADQQRIPLLWASFLEELKTSTNLLCRMESKALALADAGNDKDVGTSFTNLFQTVFENRDVLISNKVDVVYLAWHLGDLVNSKTLSEQWRSLSQIFYSDYSPEFVKMESEYRAKTVPTAQTASAFEKQKQYLTSFAPFDFITFNKVFDSQNYTKAQAFELKPLIEAYKSNLVAQASAHQTNDDPRAFRLEKIRVESNVKTVEFFLERQVDNILNPPTRVLAARNTMSNSVSNRKPEAISATEMVSAFQEQKHYLANFTPFDQREFNKTFRPQNYTKAQAAELLPLISAYESNLMAQLPPNGSQFEKMKARGNVEWIGSFLEQHVNTMALAPKHITSNSISNQVPEATTNVLLVNKFLPIPLDGLPGDKISGVRITAHHWLDGKLVLDFQYGAFIYSFDEKGNWTSTRNVNFAGVAILDPATERWQVIGCPEVDAFNGIWFYHRTTLYRGDVFTSEGGQIRKYDVAKKSWQVLEIPEAGNCELFTVNDRLFAVTQNLIVEILDGGTRTQILASNRRQPPSSALDTENLGTPVLFAGPGQSLRAVAGNKIVAWDGKDWHTICPAPQQTPLPAVISGDDVLFFVNGWNSPAGIWRMPATGDQVEFCFGQISPRGLGVTDSSSGPNSKPEWKVPSGMSLPRLAAASRGVDMFLLADHAKSENIVDEQQHLIIGTKVLPQDGYHAQLLCFGSNYAAPQTIFLKFQSNNARLPIAGDNQTAGHMAPNFMLPDTPSTWLLFSSNFLFCGQETFIALPQGGGDPRIAESKTGVWMISAEQMNAEIARQRTAQREQQAQSEVLAKQTVKSLLEKYDLNHNGVLDENEREEALDDPAFIKTQLDAMDTNHNGWLEASELTWFDANQNKILDPKEQAGINLAVWSLAESLLKQFGQTGNDWLTMSEYNNMIDATLHINGIAGFNFQFVRVDANHDGHIDLEELQSLLRMHLHLDLKTPRGMHGPIFADPMGMPGQLFVESSQRFKGEVEAYWQNPGGRFNHPPMSGRTPSGEGNP